MTVASKSLWELFQERTPVLAPEERKAISSATDREVAFPFKKQTTQQERDSAAIGVMEGATALPNQALLLVGKKVAPDSQFTKDQRAWRDARKADQSDQDAAFGQFLGSFLGVENAVPVGKVLAGAAKTAMMLPLTSEGLSRLFATGNKFAGPLEIARDNADRLRKSGATNEQIWAETSHLLRNTPFTGVEFKNLKQADATPMVEIPPDYEPAKGGFKLPFYEELMGEPYPEVVFNPFMGEGEHAGLALLPEGKQVQLNPRYNKKGDQVIRNLEHEGQHAVQQLTPVLERGSNPEAQYSRDAAAELTRIDQFMERLQARVLDGKLSPEAAIKRAEKALPKFNKLEEQAYRDYRTSPGEVAAGTAELRTYLTPEQKRKLPFSVLQKDVLQSRQEEEYMGRNINQFLEEMWRRQEDSPM